MDACGVGALPDAERYGDAGANTLLHLAQLCGELALPALGRLGLGCILPLPGVPPATGPALFGALHALGPGKDSIAGHWELMGVVAPAPAPTYPDGFPEPVIRLITGSAARGVICNRPFNGIDVIERYGAEHLRSGSLIVYTSQDSVLQIAAHEDVVPAQQLYAICAAVRAGLAGEHAVGRVIARPFRGSPGAFARTEGRRDLALAPPSRSYLDALQDAGVPVHSVGKAGSLFAGRGVDHQHPGATNAAALGSVDRLVGELDHGMVFANLIETDQVYGHRHDADGFHAALREIDRHVGRWLEQLRDGDLLILTADHGVDLTMDHTDHTREHVPLLARARGEPAPRSGRHDGAMADVGASVLQWLTGGRDTALPGTPFL